jgi:hypothetical protein
MPKKSKKSSAAQIHERRNGRDFLFNGDPKTALGFTASKEGGQVRVTNHGEEPIAVAKSRRTISPGSNALVSRDIVLTTGVRKFVCR